jgi:hypothetical protein
MKKRNGRLFASALLLLAMVFLTGCANNNDGNEPGPLTSSFELVYSTYWGGEAGTEGRNAMANKGNAICVDRDGYIYLAGETQSPLFYLKNPICDETFSTTGFVSKFTPGGHEVVYSTFLGDPQGYNFCVAMDVDDQGNAIVGGMAGGQEFPLKNPLYDTFSEPWLCGFLSSIAPQGAALNFSTFILEQRVIALVLDDQRDIYLATMDNSVLKISGDGQRLLYKYKMPFTSNNDVVTSIAVTPGGSLVVVGWTSTWYFPSRNPVQAAPGGKADAFILKIDPQGNELEFATRLGGAEDDLALDVALGTDGSIYACGFTASADFPLKNAADPVLGGTEDAFVARVDPASGTLLYSTFLGGSGEDRATAITLDAAGAAYMTGYTTSSDFPIRGALLEKLGGVKDPFVTKLSAGGDKVLLSTYFGGALSSLINEYNHVDPGADWGNDICLGADGRIYITGETGSKDFPMLNPLDTSNRFTKAFIAILREKRL